jgi:hypothetical protein
LPRSVFAHSRIKSCLRSVKVNTRSVVVSFVVCDEEDDACWMPRRHLALERDEHEFRFWPPGHETKGTCFCETQRGATCEAIVT